MGVITLLCGLLVIASTFLAWTTGSPVVGANSSSGWNIMRASTSAALQEGGGGGFNLALTGEGTIFFTGFWSMLLGALILLGGVTILFRRRAGGVLTLLFGVGASMLAAVNVAMVFTKMSSPYASIYPGPGLWVFLAFSLLALALGITGLARPG